MSPGAWVLTAAGAMALLALVLRLTRSHPTGRHAGSPIRPVTVTAPDDPDEYLAPLRSGGTRASRRLVATYRERGMMPMRRVPASVRKRVQRTLRSERNHERDQ